MTSNSPFLDIALENRLITKKQYKHVCEELEAFPGQDPRELLVRKHFLTAEQAEQLAEAVGAMADDVAEPESPPPPQTEMPTDPAPSIAPPPVVPPPMAPAPDPVPATAPVAVDPPTAPTAKLEKKTPQQSSVSYGAAKQTAMGRVGASEEPEAGGPTRLKDFLRLARHWGASDLHLSVGQPPFVRMHGRLRYMEMAPLSAEESELLNFSLLSGSQTTQLLKDQNLDFGLDLGKSGRFRCNIFRQRLGWDGVYRVISQEIPSLEQLGLPATVKNLTEYYQGLVLVTGPTRSGKTTTVASMVDLVNRSREDHIVTIEDPIEYVHEPIACQVTQREVGPHTESFSKALRAALREDPDIILVGELRDMDTMSIAISAAETGHLVFGTLHTGSAARTISRVLDVFPIKQQEQITLMISESIRGIVSQRLLPRADGEGMVLAAELLVTTSGVSSLIKEGKLHQLVNAMQAGKRQGMQTMDDALMELARSGVVSGEDAWRNAENKSAFEALRSQGGSH